MQLLTTLNSARSDHCRFKRRNHQAGWGRTAFDEWTECNWSPSYKRDCMDSVLSGCDAVSLGNRSRRFETWWPHLKTSKRSRTGHFRQLKMSLRSLETSGTDYSVTRRQIPKERNLTLTREMYLNHQLLPRNVPRKKKSNQGT